MGTITKLTTKHQTTIPAEVRRALDLKAGDRVAFIIEEGKVSILKAAPDISDAVAFALTQTHAMRDWDTPEDDEAFRDI